MMWFPRPRAESHVTVLEPSGSWTARGVFELLVDPAAKEWRDKVGVGGGADGSAKTTTRLLECRGWVAKTRLDLAFRTAEEALASLTGARAAGRATGVWHPDKVWALLESDDGAWYPLTLCPELETLRRLPTLEARCLAWTRMIQAGIDVHRLHGVGLDLHPANFGFERGAPEGRLYYLDEEFYTSLEARNVAGALASRLPEEDEEQDAVEVFRRWGAELRAAVDLAGASFGWETLVQEIHDYPLATRFAANRDALLEGISAARGSVRPSTGPQADRRASSSVDEITCVLADVHANLAALTAVLAEARAMGATSYLFLGDVVGYGPEPTECVRRIAELPGLVAVRGNHDHAIATDCYDVGMNRLALECAMWTRSILGKAELDWLEALPLDHGADGWMAVHGAPQDSRRFLAYVYELTYEDNLRYLRDKEVSICFHGHSHVQAMYVETALGASKLTGEHVVTLKANRGAREAGGADGATRSSKRSWLTTWLINPGSVGQPRDGDPRAAYALWNRRTGELASRRVAYDISATARSLRDQGLPPRLEQRLLAGS